MPCGTSLSLSVTALPRFGANWRIGDLFTLITIYILINNINIYQKIIHCQSLSAALHSSLFAALNSPPHAVLDGSPIYLHYLHTYQVNLSITTIYIIHIFTYVHIYMIKYLHDYCHCQSHSAHSPYCPRHGSPMNLFTYLFTYLYMYMFTYNIYMITVTVWHCTYI